MAFTLSGSTITQSGTDTSVDGLAGIAGVTSTTMGDEQLYNLGALTLNITGTLTDASPRIVTNGRIVFSNGCNVNFGTEANGVITTKTLLLEANFNSGPWNGDSAGNGCFEFADGCNVTIRGGNVGFGGATRFSQTCQVAIKGTTLYPTRLYSGSGGKYRFFNNTPSQVAITDCVNRGMLFDLFRVPTLDGTSHVGAVYGFQALSAAYFGTDAVFSVRGFDILEKSGTDDLDNYNNADIKLINPVRGSALTISNGANNADAVLARMYKEFNVSLSSGGSNLANAKVSVVDNNNGNRQGGNKSPNSGINYNFSANQTNIATTGANGKFSSNMEVLTAFYYKNGQTRVVDRRGKSNVAGEDLFDIKIIAYGYGLKSSTQELKGAGVLDYADQLFVDPLVTELNAATVGAYSELLTPQQVYDYAFKWLYDNYANQDALLVTLEGAKLDCKSLNLVLDATAAQVLALSGNTLTIKASAFVGDIKTTGTVTLSNGATVVGGIQDANADSSITVTTPGGYDNSIEVYASASNAESETSSLNSGATFRYNATTYGGQTLWWRLENSNGGYLIVPHQIPAGVGVYNQPLVVTNENAALSKLVIEVALVKEQATIAAINTQAAGA